MPASTTNAILASLSRLPVADKVLVLADRGVVSNSHSAVNVVVDDRELISRIGSTRLQQILMELVHRHQGDFNASFRLDDDQLLVVGPAHGASKAIKISSELRSSIVHESTPLGQVIRSRQAEHLMPFEEVSALIDSDVLSGSALDWAAAISMGWKDVKITGYNIVDEPEETFFRPAKVVNGVEVCGSGSNWSPSTSWDQGGPLLFSNQISTLHIEGSIDPLRAWESLIKPAGHANVSSSGPDQLVAGMRCLVKYKLGRKVAVPYLLTARGTSLMAPEISSTSRAPRP